MIPRTKHGDCSNQDCRATNTNVVKVGRDLFCLKCRQKQKATAQLNKAQKNAISRKIYKTVEPIRDKEKSEKAYLIVDLDDVVSKYVRSKEANKDGVLYCYTCNKAGDWKSFDCGHYVGRSFMKLRWDLRNLRPQCVNCNRHLYGNIEVYGERLEKETPGIVELLVEESRDAHKWSLQELKEMLIDYRSKLKMSQLKFKK